MLNIFLKKCKTKSKNTKYKKKIYKIIDKYIVLKQNNVKKTSKEFLPANKQWFSSVYAYNKNYLKNLPSYDKTVSKLIKSFFFLHPINARYSYIKTYKTIIRSSINRIWLSKAEIKHTNSKAIFTLYIYNGEKRYLVRKLRKINPLKLKKKAIKKKIRTIMYKKSILMKLIKHITGHNISRYKQYRKYWFKDKKRFKKKRFKKDNNILLYLDRDKKNKSKYPRWLSQLLRKFLKKILKKEKLSIYCKYRLWFNKSKFKNTFISPLSKLIRNFYDKKIEFNLINLKYLHFNSSIFFQFLVKKLKNRKVRLKKFLKLLFRKLILSPRAKFIVRSRKKALGIKSQQDKYLYPFYLLKKTSLPSQYNKKNIIKNELLNQLIEKTLLIEQNKNLEIEKKDKNYLEKIILNNIKYKLVSGVRIDLAGRLSRRFVASRSISIKKSKGSLKNVESSYKGLSTSMIRDQLKSNIECTKITSFMPIGSFGVKGWISTI